LVDEIARISREGVHFTIWNDILLDLNVPSLL
jgi:hypothetical protein